MYISGNKVVFSLETASDYVKDEKACFFGFKCVVVGYEWKTRPEEVRHSNQEVKSFNLIP